MRYPGRSIACISTQAGCAMGCVFCATGQMGFVRHLRPGEIVAQVLYVIRRLREQGETLRNVVLMGMGEPLHNYRATIDALSIMMDDRGLALAPKHITLSTVGLPKGIRRLADDDVGVNLAVSLHGSNDQDRVAIVPVAHRWPLDDIIAACHYYASKRRRRIFFEWALIAGTNDDPKTAHKLGQLLDGLDAHVNLIPLNPTDSYEGLPSSPQAIQDFQTILASYGLPSTVRQRRGIDIDAGCGQLRARATRQQA
jgi:23S rRNA (adenine2503-C2)-methyltransferase